MHRRAAPRLCFGLVLSVRAYLWPPCRQVLGDHGRGDGDCRPDDEEVEEDGEKRVDHVMRTSVRKVP